MHYILQHSYSKANILIPVTALVMKKLPTPLAA
jgi:hypothetical protein